MKTCTKCGIAYELSKYYKDNRKKDGLFACCKDCHNLMCVKYHGTDKFRDYRAKYEYNRYRSNIQFKLTKILRSRIRMAIKTNAKVGSAVSDLGCSIPELKKYLESKFQHGMTWKNLSKNGWNIDHIVPLDSFDLSDREQFLKACHFTNLQPLWAIDNMKKGNR